MILDSSEGSILPKESLMLANWKYLRLSDIRLSVLTNTVLVFKNTCLKQHIQHLNQLRCFFFTKVMDNLVLISL